MGYGGSVTDVSEVLVGGPGGGGVDGIIEHDHVAWIVSMLGPNAMRKATPLTLGPFVISSVV
jgi:hypothetical protein